MGKTGLTILYIYTAFLSRFLVSKSSHTHIQISHKDDYIPGTRDRKVNIKGEPRAVAEAYHLIFEKVSYLCDNIYNIIGLFIGLFVCLFVCIFDHPFHL